MSIVYSTPRALALSTLASACAAAFVQAAPPAELPKVEVTGSSDAYEAPPAIRTMIFGRFEGLREETKATSRSALCS